MEEFLISYGMVHSYSRKGTPYDNPPIESFHSTLKKEKLNQIVLKNYDQAK